MPNWVYNTLTIEGDASRIAEVKAKLAQPFTTYFPKTEYDREKQEWVSTPDTQVTEQVISFYNIISPTDTEAYYKPEFSKPKGEAYDATKVMEEFALNIQKENDWYYWNLREWGCKWDAGEPYLNEQVTNDTTLCYQFETPWSPPLEAVEKLAQQYPDVTIKIEFEEEQGWGGVVLWRDRKMTILDEWVYA